MTEAEQKKAAKLFVEDWTKKIKSGVVSEKGYTQTFWNDLLVNVCGIEAIKDYIVYEYEAKTVGKHTTFIDGYIPDTKVIIEQKDTDKDLLKRAKQSDGTECNAFEQADRYDAKLKPSQKANYIITCNFREFYIYDLEKVPRGSDPYHFMLEELPREYEKLKILKKEEEDINISFTKEEEISKKAGYIIGEIYDSLAKQYDDIENNKQEQRDLNILCVRLVFCLYAEDSGVFDKAIFRNFLKNTPVNKTHSALKELFKWLDTKDEDRDKYPDPSLIPFPYVNGGLFEKEDIEIPYFTEKIKEQIIHNASEEFNWSAISPTIFGACFESCLNPETRRSEGMHYTSIENIHKVIDVLFLDDLKQELKEIKKIGNGKQPKKVRDAIEVYINKLSSITCFDPAAGSGNFLTETYLSLRRLENEALKVFIANESTSTGGMAGDMLLSNINWVKVSIKQFYGVEINDYAVSVAKTALWIAESQMIKETEELINQEIAFLPLESIDNIHEGNALEMDWKKEIATPDQIKYIFGNPPFRGSTYQSDEQKEDIAHVSQGKIKKYGILDYVCGWYIKAAQYINGTDIRCAFVSTNSITQGDQPSVLWKYLYELNNKIDFAYKTFPWGSEALSKASVHCVIIGFSQRHVITNKVIIDGNKTEAVFNITPYLSDGESVLVEARSTPLWDVPKMIAGNKPVRAVALMMDEKEKEELIQKEPKANEYIKRIIGSEEFINNIPRYVLWLTAIEPNELKSMPLVLKRVEEVKKDRETSKDKQANALAKTPYLFRDLNNPQTAIVVPGVSSKEREYIPIGYIDDSVIALNKVEIIPDGTMYDFGILTSVVHNAWMRQVAMRMKSDYSYSVKIVYNNFPWPEKTEANVKEIEKTAKDIITARNNHANSSLADLYNTSMMPVDLRKAHDNNDKAVKKAYGFGNDISEKEIVEKLMKMYKRKLEQIKS